MLQKSKDSTRSVVPKPTEYLIASGKEVLRVLQSAADVLPVPFLKDAIEVALKIIEVCEVRQSSPSIVLESFVMIIPLGGICC